MWVDLPERVRWGITAVVWGFTGSEPSRLSTASDEHAQRSTDASGAKSGVLGVQIASVDADLLCRIGAELQCRHHVWRALPEVERVAILTTACQLIRRIATSAEGRKSGAEPAERGATP